MTTREQVTAAARSAFAHVDTAAVLVVLDLYGTEPHERERERVQLTILALCEGSEDKLLSLVQAAKVDYRDVLAWAETGPLPAAQGEQLQQQARDLVARWGKPKE